MATYHHQGPCNMLSALLLLVVVVVLWFWLSAFEFDMLSQKLVGFFFFFEMKRNLIFC